MANLFPQNVDQKLFHLLVSSVKDYAIFMIDVKGIITTWNQGATHIKGYKDSEIIGKHISVFYTQEDREANEPNLNLSQALQLGSYESEGWRVKKNGSVFWANVVFTPLYDEEHKHIGFAKITRDITEIKLTADEREAANVKLEKRVQQQTEKIIANELRFRKLIENSHDGISLLDENFNVFFRSLSAERINGWSDDERQTTLLEHLVHPDDRQALTDSLCRY